MTGCLNVCYIPPSPRVLPFIADFREKYQNTPPKLLSLYLCIDMCELPSILKRGSLLLLRNMPSVLLQFLQSILKKMERSLVLYFAFCLNTFINTCHLTISPSLEKHLWCIPIMSFDVMHPVCEINTDSPHKSLVHLHEMHKHTRVNNIIEQSTSWEVKKQTSYHFLTSKDILCVKEF